MNRKPDILVLMTDQHNPYSLGCAGNREIQTPHIDSLASEGAFFSRCYSVSPVCMPARCSAVSGLYPHNHGVWHNMEDRSFPLERIGLFHDLRDAGYLTIHAGKSHWFSFDFGADYRERDEYYRLAGIDRWVEIPGSHSALFHPSAYSDHLREQGRLKDFVRSMSEDLAEGGFVPMKSRLSPADHVDGITAQKAIELLETVPADQPVFLNVSFPGPHPPLDPPAEFYSEYDPESLTPASNVPETISRPRRSGKRDHRFVQECLAAYYGKITHIDAWIGNIIDAFKRRGTWDSTLTVFFSDHGEYMGAHGRFGKCGFHEESVRVPLLMRQRGVIPEGSRPEALAEIIDIYPTLVGAAGGNVSKQQFGQNLLPVAEGSVEKVRDCAFSEIGSDVLQYMAVTEEFKYTAGGGDEKLWNLKNDPLELNDLSANKGSSASLDKMRSRLSFFLKNTQINLSRGYRPLFDRAGAGPGEKITAEQIETLTQSWYPGL